MKTRFICLALVIVLLCPAATAQWVKSLDSVSVLCLLTIEAGLLAGTLPDDSRVGCLYLSTDTGSSWTAVYTPLPVGSVGSTFINAIAVSDTNLFVAIRGGDENGVVLSTNNGTTWTAVNTGLTDTWVTCFAVA